MKINIGDYEIGYDGGTVMLSKSADGKLQVQVSAPIPAATQKAMVGMVNEVILLLEALKGDIGGNHEPQH